jgi:hypothetical protein
MGIEVEIASFSQAVQKLLLPLPFLRPRSWISGRRRRRIFTGGGIIEKPVTENGWRVCTGLVSLAGQRANLEGVQSYTHFPAVRVTKSITYAHV